MYHRHQTDAPLPHDRHFIVSLADGSSLRIIATSQLVTIYHHEKLHQEPLYRAMFLLADNPGLSALYSPKIGWDIIGLISLMRSEIEQMATLNLRGSSVKQELGIETVSAPSHDRIRQEKRPVRVGLKMIVDFVREHPGCTRLDIARGIERAKSPYLLTQIEWLVHEGYLARSHATSANGTLEFTYVFLAQYGDNSD